MEYTLWKKIETNTIEDDSKTTIKNTFMIVSEKQEANFLENIRSQMEYNDYEHQVDYKEIETMTEEEFEVFKNSMR